MSNIVSMVYTKFENLTEDGEVEDVMFGYRIYDEYDSAYNNCYNSFSDLIQDLNKENVLGFIKENHEEFYDEIIDRGYLSFNNKTIKI